MFSDRHPSALKTFSTRLPIDLITRLSEQAQREGVTQAELVRRLIEDGLARPAAKPRRSAA